MSYWLVACNAEGMTDGGSQTLDILKSRVYERSGLVEELCKFEVPGTLKFGSFDNLIKLLDDLQKYDGQVESVLRRVERQLLELDPMCEFKIISQRAQMSWDYYIRKFAWDDAKFPRTRAIMDNLQLLLSSVQKLDEEVRNKATQYSDLKTQLNATTKKDSGSLVQKDLIDVLTPDVVRPDDFINTEHLTTVVVIVARGAEKDWLSFYEYSTEFVVPKSTKKFPADDKDGNSLWRVVLFKSAVDKFKTECRAKKFVVRDFAYSASRYQEVMEQRGSLEAEAKKHETFVRRVCHAAFSDTLVAWMHLKAMRVFVEAVLRFGVPPNFNGFLLKPTGGAAKQAQLRANLADIFKGAGAFGSSYHAAPKGDGEGGGAGEMESGEYYPYVSLAFTPIAAKA